MKNKNEIVAILVSWNNIWDFLASTSEANMGASILWYDWYGHLRIQILYVMQRSGIVVNIPPI